MPVEVTCRKCGGTFSCAPSDAKRRSTCSACAGRKKTAPRVGLFCCLCGKAYEVVARRAKTSRYCSFRCKQIVAGRNGGAIAGEQKKAASKGRTYTKTRGRHTHRVVMEQILGRPLRPGEVVHHKDGNKLNNSPENLELLQDQKQHARAHIPELLAKRKAKHGY